MEFITSQYIKCFDSPISSALPWSWQFILYTIGKSAEMTTERRPVTVQRNCKISNCTLNRHWRHKHHLMLLKGKFLWTLSGPSSQKKPWQISPNTSFISQLHPLHDVSPLWTIKASTSLRTIIPKTVLCPPPQKMKFHWTFFHSKGSNVLDPSQ